MNNSFISKVYQWLCIGLVITFGCGYLLSINTSLLTTLFNIYHLLAIAEVVVGFVFILAINKLSDTLAKILYCSYAALTGVTFGAVFLVYDVASIMYVFLATAIIFAIMSFVGKNIKANLNGIATFLAVALLGMIVLSIINIFVANQALDLTIAFVVLIIFIAYIMIDINRIYKKDTNGLSEKHAVYWAFQLYLDIINIILELLRLFGKSRD